MKNRRGSSLWPETDGLSSMIYRFEPGDIVVPVAVRQEHFLGVVKEVLPRINKIMVLWNGGSLKQHDPDEIMLEPHQNEIVRTRMASSRRSRGKSAEKIVKASENFEFAGSRRGSAVLPALKEAVESPVPHGEQFVGDPEIHGIDEPRSGGFSIMQDLQKDLHKEQKKESEAGPKTAGDNVIVKFGADRIVKKGDTAIWEQKGFGKYVEKMGAKLSDKKGVEKLADKWNSWAGSAHSVSPRDITAAASPSPEQLYRGIRNGLLSVARKVSRLFPDVNLRYGDRQLMGTVAGHDVKVFYDIYRASNGEVTGLPVIVLDGKRYDKFYRNVEDKLQELLGQVVTASEERKATGEMGYHDIQPGGDHYEWAKTIESAAKQLQRKTGNKIRFQGMKPFDVYQGPYASMNYGKLWSGENEGEFYYDWRGYLEISGDIDDIAEAVKEKIRGMTASSDSRMAVEITKKEWQEALDYDEEMLEKYQDALSELEKGGKVENLTAENAKKAIRGLKEVIKNKKNMMSRMSSDYSNLRSRRAMYWGAPDRIYRLTKNEQENGTAVCPRCKAEMQKEPFTKSEKLYTCQSCGFKVPSSKTTTTKIEIEVEDGEVTDVDVTTARRGKKSSLAKELVGTISGSPKEYYIMTGIGKSKYVVNFHDGVKTNRDGSEFYDIRIFRNKSDMEAFVSELSRKGYKYGERPIYKSGLSTV